ncbi:MAG: hypothetical protein QOG73_4935 [Acetobacteraceae bacterium]|jgi:hypothetical protein|nr:hypothetical protein [Acetobacteraceae bacterium]
MIDRLLALRSEQHLGRAAEVCDLPIETIPRRPQRLVWSIRGRNPDARHFTR